ncbi:MAG: DUF882 domain-containing protein [Gammaproteobacteria bacterium]|nr:DUF882 domain-containing protein [Gammaproteobacteria bacterium]
MNNPSRRQFLTLAAATAIAPTAPSFAKVGTDRILSMRNLHTGEHLDAAYWVRDDYLKSGLKQFNKLLRDHRANEITRMEPKLLDLVYQLKEKLNYNGEIEVISGYRSAKTNASLRARSKGVARKSYHMRGMAMDLRMPGVSLANLRQAAIGLQLGGVGYYPKSNFVHVDVGPVRRW